MFVARFFFLFGRGLGFLSFGFFCNLLIIGQAKMFVALKTKFCFGGLFLPQAFLLVGVFFSKSP